MQKPNRTGGDCATTADPLAVELSPFAEIGLTGAEAAKIAAGLRAEQQAAKRVEAPPTLAAGSIGLVLQRVEGKIAAEAGDAQSLARYIFNRVKDPKLMRCVCDTVAWAVVKGEYPRQKLEGILSQTDAQRATGRTDAWVYFVGVMKRSWFQHGLGELTKRKSN